ncbi:hypothetical protein [Agrococcus jejuensis]|uniref:PQQ-like domain-containing protein n=1 Tax=Agrococcus jejuensis TaxID=399736 RepID=A0A1G8C513_9MICO|nr:hypothetical protein [Agrococcus jejuensis]SDH40399.1 hypothetical protein SAMN04489720_1165 [Agrococcus jejuensis]
MHRRSTAVVVAALAAALTGCVIQPPELAAVTEVWRVDDRLVTAPVEESGTLLAYTTAGPDSLDVVAWDGVAGTELWRAASVPMSNGDIVDLEPMDDGSGRLVVPMLVAEGDGVRWSVRDLATGEEQAWSTASADGTQTTWDLVYYAWSCSPDVPTTSICFSVPDGTETTAEFLRLRPGHGVDALPIPNEGTVFATDLGLYTDQATQTIDLIVDGQIRWSRPWSDAFGHVYEDGAIEPLRSGDLLLVTSGPAWWSSTLQFESVDTVALEASSGAVRWTVEGAFPCAIEDADVVILCALAGARTGAGTTLTGVSIVGVDAATGAERWRVPYSDAGVAIENGAGAWSWFSGSAALVPDASGAPVVLDAADGTPQPIAADAPLPCSQGAEGSVAWTDGGLSIPIEELAEWCSLDGARLTDPELDADVLAVVGIPVGDVRVVAMASGIAAYRIG